MLTAPALAAAPVPGAVPHRQYMAVAAAAAAAAAAY